MPKIYEKIDRKKVLSLMKSKGIKQVDIVKALNKKKQHVSQALTSDKCPGLLLEIMEFISTN